jgi:FMN phosphatase YigB (HAD superfamily)
VKGSVPRAVTIDLWHALAYLPAASRNRIEKSREAVWVQHLQRAGVAPGDAALHSRSLQREIDRLERIGRAPSIPSQVGMLGRLAAVRLPSGALQRDLDSVLPAAPVRRVPGALREVRRLHSEGLKLALVSNVVHESPAGVRQLLRRLGLATYWSAEAFSADLPWSKPDPRIFRWALQELGIPAAEAIHVGDLALDLNGARRAGMRALRLVWEARRRGIRRPVGPQDVLTWDEARSRILDLRTVPSGPSPPRK